MKRKQIESYECYVCHTKIKSKLANLRRHMALHGPNIKSYKCFACEKIYQTKSNLRIYWNKTHQKEQKSITKSGQSILSNGSHVLCRALNPTHFSKYSGYEMKNRKLLHSISIWLLQKRYFSSFIETFSQDFLHFELLSHFNQLSILSFTVDFFNK